MSDIWDRHREAVQRALAPQRAVLEQQRYAKLNSWDQLVYNAIQGTASDRVYSPFSDKGSPSANARVFSGLGSSYTVLPTDYRMGEEEVTKLLNQALESYQPYTTYSTFKREDGRLRRVKERRQNPFEIHLQQATGGKLKFGQRYDREVYDATQGLVRAEREMEAARKLQAEQQARQQAEQQAAAEQQAKALAEQQERTRQQEQYKASTESGNLQPGGDAPTVITGKANSPTTNSDLSIGRGGNRRRGSSLSSILGLF